MSKGNISVLSRCGEYIASSLSNGTIEVHRLSNSLLFRRYNLRRVVKNHYSRNVIDNKENMTILHVRQVEWEEIVEDGESTKFAVVLNNFVMVFDITIDNSEPLVVQQPANEGIEKIQWIPPSEEDHVSGGYVNSKQFVVFTNLYLQMKLYSVDCTHILLTILKPVLKSIIVRPRKRNNVWSVIADTLEYSTPAIMYHFYNEGSTSVLLQSLRLPKVYLSAPRVEWSDSGKWLLMFNDKDSIYGFDLKVYDSLGVSGKLLIDLNYVKDSILDKFNDENATKLVLQAQNYTSKWISVQDNEYLLVASVSLSKHIKFLLVSTKLIRIINQTSFPISKIVNSWKQVNINLQVKYRNIAQRTFSLKSTTIRKVSSINTHICLHFDDALIIFTLDLVNNEFKLLATISLELSVMILKAFEYENLDQMLIATFDHVAIYNFSTQELEVIYSNKVRNAFVELEGSKLFIIIARDSLEPSISNWERIEVKKTPPKQKVDIELPKRHNERIKIGLIDTSNIDEFTDTFNTRKRLKR